MREIIDRAMAIDGVYSLTRNELELLYQFAEKMDSIVEIGSFFGRSTFVLCSACHGQVYAVDPFTLWSPAGEDPYQKFLENTKGFTNLTVLKMTSEEASHSKLIPPLVDMVFIDGNHQEAPFYRDLELWNHRAKQLVCGHDFGPGDLGVEKALVRFYGAGRFIAPQKIWWTNR